jgi:hypothetical protein
MSGVYDQLAAKLGGDDQDKPAGLSPLEMADLPEAQRQVMFGLLRDTDAPTAGMTLEGLRAKFSHVDGLADVLADLTKNGWLIRLGESPHVHYRVNLRRKRAASLGANVWALLSVRLSKSGDEEKGESAAQPPDSDPPNPSFPTLKDW